MPAQGELRGPKAQEQKARRGGGDWDANADDFAEWVEPQPGDQCRAYLMGEHSVLFEEIDPLQSIIARVCTRMAPVGSSICTPCHRRRIRTTARRKSLEHRQCIAEQTGKPLEEIK